MCNCCRNSTATLWAVSPVSAQSGCGSYTSQTNNASTCGYSGCSQYSSSATANGYGCFGGCSRGSACQTGYSVRQVSGCSNCPFARTCSCCGCMRNWCGN